MEFRNRSVHRKGRYPAVHWPEHPTSYKDGNAYIHHIVWFEHTGLIPTRRMHVHHVDENVWNWRIENLQMINVVEHMRLHNKARTQRRLSLGKPTSVEQKHICARSECGREFVGSRNRKRSFCSRSCFEKESERTVWPDADALRKMVDGQSYVAVGKLLGVSDNAVKKRLARSSMVRAPSL
jgi:hypothetical protein